MTEYAPRNTQHAPRSTPHASRIAQHASRITRHASRPLVADVALLSVTAIWGATFVMVKGAVSAYPVFSFMALRFAVAALALLPFVLLRRGNTGMGEWGQGERRRSGGAEEPRPAAAPALPLSLSPTPPLSRSLPLPHSHALPLSSAPLLLGLALFAGFAFQTAGLSLTTPAKAGFITGLAVVIVPVVSAWVLRQAAGRNAWLGVVSATAGLALLSLQSGLNIAPGDLLVFCCALSFAAHILLTGRFAPHHDPLVLTFGQVVVVTLLSGVAALLFDPRPAGALPFVTGLNGQVIFAAAFTGVLATALAFGVQTAAQRFTNATHAALIFAAEPVFAALFSLLLIGETLGPRQVLGCGLILGGMVVAELKQRG